MSTYTCEGCGKTGDFKSDVYPRAVFTNQSATVCDYCRGRLDGWMTEKWRQWFEIQRETMRKKDQK